jgi:hypothetical protein
MRRKLKWLALVPGVLFLALALMALAEQRGPGLTSALFLALFFLSVPFWGGFAGGTHTRTYARMSRIEMWGGPAGGTAELLRQYRLGYQSNSITGRSLLRSLTECDRDEKCRVSLPFEYLLGSGKFEKIDVDASDPTPVTVVDINGDGRSDLIGAAHGGPDLRVAVRRVEGDGFASPRYSGLPVRTVQTLDADAGGRPDALAGVLDDEPDPGYQYQLFQPTQNPLAKFEAVPGKLGERHKASSSQLVYLADLDGSGLPDFVGTAFEAHKLWSYRLNTGAAGGLA